MEASILSLRVTPNAAETRCESVAEDGTFRVRVRAQPERGKANKVLVRFLAKELRIGRTQIEWVSGETSRLKRLRVHGLSVQEIQDRLLPS